MGLEYTRSDHPRALVKTNGPKPLKKKTNPEVKIQLGFNL
jgi:hypothetical protein